MKCFKSILNVYFTHFTARGINESYNRDKKEQILILSRNFNL